MFNLEVKYLNIIEALPTSTHIFQDPLNLFLGNFENFKFWFLENVATKINSLQCKRDFESRDENLVETMILKYHLCNELPVAVSIAIDLSLKNHSLNNFEVLLVFLLYLEMTSLP